MQGGGRWRSVGQRQHQYCLDHLPWRTSAPSWFGQLRQESPEAADGVWLRKLPPGLRSPSQHKGDGLLRMPPRPHTSFGQWQRSLRGLSGRGNPQLYSHAAHPTARVYGSLSIAGTFLMLWCPNAMLPMRLDIVLQNHPRPKWMIRMISHASTAAQMRRRVRVGSSKLPSRWASCRRSFSLCASTVSKDWGALTSTGVAHEPMRAKLLCESGCGEKFRLGSVRCLQCNDSTHARSDGSVLQCVECPHSSRQVA